ncbi:MAG: mechanosensitive ion channel [Sneathiellaceae bacterium]
MPRLLLSCCTLLALLLLPMLAMAQANTTAPADAGSTLTPAEARVLSKLLNDTASLDALRGKLDAIAQAPETAAAPAKKPSRPLGVARQIAEVTGDSAESAALFVSQIGDALSGLTTWELRQEFDLALLSGALAELVTVVVAAFALLLLLRLAFRRIAGRLAASAVESGVVGSLFLLLLTGAVEAVAVVLAWAGGYLAAVTMIGTAEVMEIEQSLFLNAFLIVGLVRVAVHTIFSPAHASLRIPPMSDPYARYWSFWIGGLAALLGYGFLFLVPIATQHLGPVTGRSLQVVIALIALLIALAVILRKRNALREHLQHRHGSPSDFFGYLLALVARFWHVAAIAYVLALFVIWLSRPDGAMTFILSATGRTVGAILLGMLVVSAISRGIAGGLRLPDGLKERLPLLEARLNTFIPNLLRIVRIVVFFVVILALLDAWRAMDVSGWLASEFGQEVAESVISAAIVLLIAWLIWLGLSSWVEFRLNPTVGRAASSRETTLLKLLRNAGTIVIAVIAVMLALSELGVDIGPLLAGAGVVGLAVGFGGQKLVQDVITGVFIQFENAINEGDVITVGSTTGTVEKLSVRSVGIRDLNGVYHIVPFSAVDRVSNYMRVFAYHVAAIGVAYREDIAEVKEAMFEAFEMLQETDHSSNILAPLEMHGITEFGDSAITVRARIKTLPGSQWAVGRAYNECIKTVFDRRGIEIPFPHQTIYWGEDKAGKAPPLRILQEKQAPASGAAAPESLPAPQDGDVAEPGLPDDEEAGPGKAD